MLLGDLLEQFSYDDVAAEAIQRLDDPKLLAALDERARAIGLSLGAYAAGAARRYAAVASEDEWTTLLGAMTGTPDPGMVYFGRAMAHAVRHPGWTRSVT